MDRTRTKICCRCSMRKPFADYNKDRSKKDGLTVRCRTCISRVNAEQYQRRKQAKAQAKPQLGD